MQKISTMRATGRRIFKAHKTQTGLLMEGLGYAVCLRRQTGLVGRRTIKLGFRPRPIGRPHQHYRRAVY